MFLYRALRTPPPLQRSPRRASGSIVIEGWLVRLVLVVIFFFAYLCSRELERFFGTQGDEGKRIVELGSFLQMSPRIL